MKLFFSVIALAIFTAVAAQPAQNVFIITLDGVRWQEIFRGADDALLGNPKFVKDTGLMKRQFSGKDTGERRQKLMPFFWSVISTDGQLMGNRDMDNKVNVANFYKISYPGYAEIFTGYANLLFIPNLAVYNRHSNVLSYLNTHPDYKGKVAAFCSWRMFPFILNETKGSFPVNAGYELASQPSAMDSIINDVQNAVTIKGKTRHDLLTYEHAKNYIEVKHPRVLYLGLGEADELAHSGNYDAYLQKIHQADALIADLWYYVQTNDFYKNNTSFIITTDHGRGRKSNNWKTHGFWIPGSGETWLAMIGAGISAEGEAKSKQQVYQKQLASTITHLLGIPFTAAHPVCKPITLLPCPPAEPGNRVAVVSGK